MGSVKQQMTKGVFWTALDKYTNAIISLIISMVLARLLTPYDFGVVATASVFLAFLTLFTSIGIAPAIIQRKDLTDDEVDHIFTFTILLGLVIGGIFFISSWPIADFYDNDLLRPVIQILSLGLFLSAMNIVPAALMSKNLRFKQMATRSIAFNVFFGIVGVLAAFLGAGVFALVCPQIIASLCTFFYNRHFYPVHIKFPLSFAPIQKIFSYSIFVFFTSFGSYLGRNLDKLIIGKTLSADALGYYDKSYRLMQYPMTYITSVVSPVMQPILSNFQDNLAELSAKYTKIVSIIATLSFPVAVILFFAAEDIIIVMYGEMWTPAVPSFKILTLSIPVTLICNTLGVVFMSCNATKEMFFLSLLGYPFFFFVYGYAMFVGKSIESFAWAWVINEYFVFALDYYVLYRRLLHQPMRPFLRALKYPFISSAILVIIYMFLNLLIPHDLYHLLQLIIRGTIGVGFVLCFLKFTNQFDAYKYVKEKLSHKETPDLR